MPTKEWPDYAINAAGDLRRLKDTKHRKAGSVVKTQRRADGYCYVHCYPGGEQIVNFLVHRMVANAFLGPPPSYEHTDVAHFDGNPSNNHVSNLRWATRAENMADIKRHDRHKLKNAEVAQIRELLAGGYQRGQRTAIAKRFGVSLTHVTRLIKGDR